MVYAPIKDSDKQDWINFLRTAAGFLDGKPEVKEDNKIFESTDVGDVSMCKDLVGNLLALLINEPVTIN